MRGKKGRNSRRPKGVEDGGGGPLGGWGEEAPRMLPVQKSSNHHLVSSRLLLMIQAK